MDLSSDKICILTSSLQKIGMGMNLITVKREKFLKIRYILCGISIECEKKLGAPIKMPTSSTIIRKDEQEITRNIVITVVYVLAVILIRNYLTGFL